MLTAQQQQKACILWSPACLFPIQISVFHNQYQQNLNKYNNKVGTELYSIEFISIDGISMAILTLIIVNWQANLLVLTTKFDEYANYNTSKPSEAKFSTKWRWRAALFDNMFSKLNLVALPGIRI